jgi:hypothetical protein
MHATLLVHLMLLNFNITTRWRSSIISTVMLLTSFVSRRAQRSRKTKFGFSSCCSVPTGKCCHNLFRLHFSQSHSTRS